MSFLTIAGRLVAVAALCSASMGASAALVCPFADGNGAATGACIEGQGTWQTSLQARDWAGNGVGVDAYYDPFLNLTWLADANYAQTSGFDADGRMTFSDANAWAAGLTLFGASGWRLPTVTPVDDTANFNISFSNNGSTDFGTARTGVGWGEDSEMGYMYYVHLGNLGRYVPNDADPHLAVEQPGWGLANTGPFANLLADLYWTDQPSRDEFGFSFAWDFYFARGDQSDDLQLNGNRAWAVHSGDLIGPAAAPVPVPGALWLLGSALVGLGARARRR